MIWRLRRRAANEASFPDEWRRILALRLPAWPTLDDGEQRRLEALVAGLVATKPWEAARGFELSEEAIVTIAGFAALVVLGDGLGLDCYRNVTSVVVHASTIVVRGEQPSHVPGLVHDDVTWLDGQAEPRGPVFLAWDAVRRDVRHPRRGRNVVVHEFAHVLDMLDGLVDGTPPLPPEDVARWVEVCTAEMERLRHPDPEVPDGPLDEYGAQDPGEFFAVAAEAFFTVPIALRDASPALYEVLARSFRQDPAARLGERGGLSG